MNKYIAHTEESANFLRGLDYKEITKEEYEDLEDIF
jgi:hypothetical protein